MRAGNHISWFLPLMGLLTALAWLTLWIWAESPYGRYLDHGDWTKIGLASSLCAALPQGGILIPLSLYVGSWVLMLAAMMLPSILPLLEIFRRLTNPITDRNLLLGLVIVGYLTVWMLFGVAAHLLDWALHELVAGSAWLTFNGWIFGVVLFGVAGAFQFSRLKYACLDKCRMPLGFTMERWRGKQKRWQSLQIGLHHGLYCVGCCWALMLLMFAVGTGSVGWMLILAILMAMEKNMPWGQHMSAPTGVALLLGSAALAMDGLGFV